MISSIPAIKTSCKRIVRNPDKTWDPNRIITRPSSVQVYNEGMLGTDGFDQRVAYYRPNVKATKSWYPRTFIHIIVASCVNAYILWYLYNRKDRKVFTYLIFLRELIDELAEDELTKLRNSSNDDEPVRKRGRTLKNWQQDESRLQGIHCPERFKEESIETLNKEDETTFKRNYKRGHCRLCRSNTSNYCDKCLIPLCSDQNPSYGNTCWKVFHTCPNF